jgi:hypothetical protein
VGATGTYGISHLTTVHPVARRLLLPGTVVFAHVPYAETDDEKGRPAVVKVTVGREVTILPGSSALSRRRFPALYVELRDLDTAGLWRPTGVRLREVTVDRIEIVHILGRLSDFDMTRLLPSPGDLFGPGGGDAARAQRQQRNERKGRTP